MVLDSSTAVALISQIISLAIGAWYLRGKFDVLRRETLEEAEKVATKLFAKQQDLMVLSTKFDNMSDTLNKIEQHLAHIAKGQKE